MDRLHPHRECHGASARPSGHGRLPPQGGARRHAHPRAARGLRGRQHSALGLLRADVGVRGRARTHGFLVGHRVDLGGARDLRRDRAGDEPLRRSHYRSHRGHARRYRDGAPAHALPPGDPGRHRHRRPAPHPVPHAVQAHAVARVWHRAMRQAPIVIAVYATLAITLGGQWIAAKLGVTAVPPLELSTMRFAIASAVLLLACAITRTPLPIARWRPIAAAAACGVVGFNSLAFVGLSLTPASDSALIIPTTIPLATALFATLIHE